MHHLDCFDRIEEEKKSILLCLIHQRNWDDALAFFNEENYQLGEAFINISGCHPYPMTPFSAMINSYRIKPYPPTELFRKVIGFSSTKDLQYTPSLSRRFNKPFSPAFYTILELEEHNFISKSLTLQLLKILIQECPESLKWPLEENGFLPLHSICSFYLQFATLDMIQLLTRYYPESVIIENQGGITPIKLLFDNSLLEVKCRVGTCKKIEQEFYMAKKNKEDSKGTSYWKCILYMLCLTTVDESNSEMADMYDLPLHALVQSVALTSEMLDFALKVHERELFVRDSNGNLPLHCVIKNRNIRSQDLLLNRNDRLNMILTAYPSAATIVDDQGDYPLMTIAKISPLWSYGVSLCLRANPVILSKRDPEYNFLPFQLVSLSCDDENAVASQRVDSLSTLYECIRTCPDIVVNTL